MTELNITKQDVKTIQRYFTSFSLTSVKIPSSTWKKETWIGQILLIPTSKTHESGYQVIQLIGIHVSINKSSKNSKCTFYDLGTADSISIMIEHGTDSIGKNIIRIWETKYSLGMDDNNISTYTSMGTTFSLAYDKMKQGKVLAG